jgi:CelD/BcsL family acetyltransferase involved in cellulose biosynthesis
MTQLSGFAAPFLVMPASGTTTGVLSLAEAARIATPWALLAESAAGDNVFYHPDFLLPAAAAFATDDVAIAAVNVEGRLAAAAPFTATRLGYLAPAARLWTHAYGPLGVPLLSAARTGDAARALLLALSPPASNRAVIIPDLPLDGPVAQALAGAARASQRSTAIIGRHTRALATRSDDGNAPARTLSPDRRHEYERLMRRLAERGTVEIETAADPDLVKLCFEEFLELEAAGWKGKARTALASDPARLTFAREVVAARADGHAVRIHTLRLDDRAIASLVSFISGRTAFTWKIAYDEGEAKASPGAQVMLAAAASLLAEPRLHRLDTCAASNHPLADALFPERAAMGTFVISPVGEGAVYRAGLAAARLEARAVAAVKRLRDRVG